MLSQQHINEDNIAIANEVQELKRKINELKSANISKESSLLLQTLDTQLSEKLKNYAFQTN